MAVNYKFNSPYRVFFLFVSIELMLRDIDGLFIFWGETKDYRMHPRHAIPLFHMQVTLIIIYITRIGIKSWPVDDVKTIVMAKI